MNRIGWFALGAVAGLTLAAAASIATYLLVVSPVRRLERTSGLDLPAAVDMSWEWNQRDNFFGQGFTLRAFSAPTEIVAAWVADCPTDFSSSRLDASGIWTQLREHGLDGASSACIMNSESTNHQETVVIASGQIFHMAMDR